MRLIDADAFEKNLDKERETATDAFDAVDFALEDTPTIDAVPVVQGYSEGDFCIYGFGEKTSRLP